jgi:hypothetical protein
MFESRRSGLDSGGCRGRWPDKAYDSEKVRQQIKDDGALPIIPSRCNAPKKAYCLKRFYRRRHKIALYEAANVLLSRITRFSKLKRWGMDVAKRRGSKRAKVALARKIAVILQRMWVDGTTYRWAAAEPIAAQA